MKLKNSFHTFFWVFLFLMGSVACMAQTPPSINSQRAINHFAKDQQLKNASISFMAVDLASGKTVAELNPFQSLAPASTLKLLTTATALEVLGKGFTFETNLEYNGQILPSGSLTGNLFVIGGGDPTLASKYFQDQTDFLKESLDRIKQKNIQNIEGAIEVDASYFEADLPRTWIWEDIANYYGAVAQGLCYRDNTFTLNFESGPAGTPTRLKSSDPEIKTLEFRNNVISSDLNRDEAYLFGGPHSNVRQIEGSIPQNRSNFKVKGAIPNPATVLAKDLTTLLKGNGVSISNQSISGSHKILYSHHSPTLKEIVIQTNQKSINLFAEALLKQIGRSQLQQGNTLTGTTAIKDFWTAKNFDTSGIFLHDGSGLSRFNAVNAAFMTDLLVYMYGSQNFECFYSSLPMAGNSGTLKHFGKNTPLENNLRAKTGSMSGVRSYCGYLKNKKGKTIAFSLIVNNYTGSAQKLSEKIEELFIMIFNS